MTSPYRYTPYLLLVLLCANLLFYIWFSGRVRESTADEIIQKAYVISRLLSDFAGRSIEGDELNTLDSAVVEVFKDRHIVSVTIHDSKGKVLFESATTRSDLRLSTFETPVKFGKKKVGTLVTCFATGDSDERTLSILRNTAALQLALFAIIAALLVLLPLRGRAGRSVPGKPEAPPLPEPFAPCAVPAVTHAILPSNLTAGVFSPPSTLEPGELFNVCSSLQRAAELLSAESNRHQLVVKHSSQCLEQIVNWKNLTLQGAERAGILIAAGGDIVTQVKGQSSAIPEAGQELPNEMNLLRQRVVNAMELVEMADNLVSGIWMELASAEINGRDFDQCSSAAAAEEMVQAGVSVIRERVFPAFSEVLDASDNIAGRLSLLLQQIDGLGDYSCDLALYGGELSNLTEEIRLLRCIGANSGDPGEEGGEIRLNLFADRLERIAGSLKKETQSLLAAANGAAATGRWAMAAFDNSREMLVRTGEAVGDAAAATILGGDFLRRSVRRSEDGAQKGTASGSLALLAKQLHGVRQPLAGEVKEVESLATRYERQVIEAAQSLEVARENLCMAVKYLADTTADTLLMAAETALLHEGNRPETYSIAIEQLIAEASASLLQLLPTRKSHKDAKMQD